MLVCFVSHLLLNVLFGELDVMMTYRGWVLVSVFKKTPFHREAETKESWSPEGLMGKVPVRQRNLGDA